jgi:hypothetical protein
MRWAQTTTIGWSEFGKNSETTPKLWSPSSLEPETVLSVLAQI